MPYHWLPPDPTQTDTRHLRLWPHRSLPQRGFVWFIGGTSALIALPLVTVLGSPVLWGLLPFLVLAIAGIWMALQRSYRDGEIVEDLTLTPAQVTLTRTGPRKARAEWQANPHWVRVELHETGGPVPQYVTLRGGPRPVEIGSFLSEEERVSLSAELRAAFARHKG
ncbi:MAG: DUF2244 domain-containing protein [Pseudotabrizicola sp.]|uniref:DUF2244 domain-containing protein n=1 Tax=Pseudotabrizicola sp. TaxID=2939647 RepID=UPI002721FF20|nr:DUF2244 domain-containing protein [Pseudotabrizicola sp.]MDO8884612.1 DUF2244 domain-containing protein [Pseudotabrizicola sp.]MDP2083479.1 DUF2244 domain-containing protein [Pseudotabrizicola sp.]MDZ7572864.1 DUF2244 domain-containing protein [Pseudotabrizicola sp.]